jgi:hypothetical protein
MKLVRTTPGSPGFEVRSFECPECERILVERVAADSLNQVKGWIEFDLKPLK